MLYGAGRLAFCTNDLDTTGNILNYNILLPQCIASFSLNAETEEAVARCLINGIRQTTASAVSAEEYVLEVSYERIDFNTLGLLYGEVPTTETNVIFPVLKETFADASTGQIVDTEVVDIASGGNPKAYDNNTGTYLEPIDGTLGVTVPSADQFVVQNGQGIEVAAGRYGNSISYIFNKTYASLNTIYSAPAGSFDKLDNLRFSGVLSSAIDGIDGIGIVIDRLDRTTVPSFTVEGTTVTITMTYRLSTQPGQRRPFRLFQISDSI